MGSIEMKKGILFQKRTEEKWSIISREDGKSEAGVIIKSREYDRFVFFPSTATAFGYKTLRLIADFMEVLNEKGGENAD